MSRVRAKGETRRENRWRSRACHSRKRKRDALFCAGPRARKATSASRTKLAVPIAGSIQVHVQPPTCHAQPEAAHSLTARAGAALLPVGGSHANTRRNAPLPVRCRAVARVLPAPSARAPSTPCPVPRAYLGSPPSQSSDLGRSFARFRGEGGECVRVCEGRAREFAYPLGSPKLRYSELRTQKAPL